MYKRQVYKLVICKIEIYEIYQNGAQHKVAYRDQQPLIAGMPVPDKQHHHQNRQNAGEACKYVHEKKQIIKKHIFFLAVKATLYMIYFIIKSRCFRIPSENKNFTYMKILFLL